MFVAIHKGSVNVTFSGKSKAIVRRLLVQHGYNLDSFDIREVDEKLKFINQKDVKCQ